MRPARIASIAASSPSKTRATPSNRSKSMPATFTTEPFGASEPVSTAMPPTAWIGSVERDARTSPSGAGGSIVGQVLGDGLAGDREAVAVEQPGVEQLLHHHRHAADAVESVMWYLPCGLVSAMWGTRLATLLKSSSSQLDLGLVGDGQQVQHRVGRAAERHDDGDGVLERLLGHDVARPDAELAADRRTAWPLA